MVSISRGQQKETRVPGWWRWLRQAVDDFRSRRCRHASRNVHTDVHRAAGDLQSECVTFTRESFADVMHLRIINHSTKHLLQQFL